MHYDVTIGIPAFRVENYIRRTMESVLSQTYPNIEFLIIDDGSDDNTLEVIVSFKNSHPRGVDMRIEKILSITELSNLTGKTRPTIYKYINAYEDGDYDSVPYSFIQLFNLMEKPNVKKIEIINYCRNNFVEVDKDDKLNDFVKYLKEHKDKLDLEKVRQIIEKEINHGGSN